MRLQNGTPSTAQHSPAQPQHSTPATQLTGQTAASAPSRPPHTSGASSSPAASGRHCSRRPNQDPLSSGEPAAAQCHATTPLLPAVECRTPLWSLSRQLGPQPSPASVAPPHAPAPGHPAAEPRHAEGGALSISQLQDGARAPCSTGGSGGTSSTHAQQQKLSLLKANNSAAAAHRPAGGCPPSSAGAAAAMAACGAMGRRLRLQHSPTLAMLPRCL